MIIDDSSSAKRMNYYDRLIVTYETITALSREKGECVMGEILDLFIGKDVIIYTINDSSSVVRGNVESVTDKWVTVKTLDSGETQVINLEYVIRVREHPRDKNGKLKTIFE